VIGGRVLNCEPLEKQKEKLGSKKEKKKKTNLPGPNGRGGFCCFASGGESLVPKRESRGGKCASWPEKKMGGEPRWTGCYKTEKKMKNEH